LVIGAWSLVISVKNDFAVLLAPHPPSIRYFATRLKTRFFIAKLLGLVPCGFSFEREIKMFFLFGALQNAVSFANHG